MKKDAIKNIKLLSRGRVSYLKDTNPLYFPSKEYIGESIYGIPYLRFIRCPMSSFHYNTYKKIYKGNICLDLGCIEGSSSFYSRSNQIIESGGLIIQSKQMDSNEKWGQLSKDIIFKDFNNVKSKPSTSIESRSI